MSAYIVTEVFITDEPTMVEYRKLSTQAMQEFGAEIVIRGGAPEMLEGETQPDRVVVLKFRDREQARAFYASAIYTDARKVREGAGTMRMILVDGVA